MTRYEFLKNAGFGGAALMTLLTACSKSSDLSPIATPGSVDFTLDLTTSANAALKNSGGYIINSNVVVARTSQGTYVAGSHICTHEARTKVVFLNNEFYCTEHGARFTTTGVGLNSYASAGLSVYKTELSGNSLRIYS